MAEAESVTDNLSDSELEAGLPSPDMSDDEEMQESEDIGIVLPHFFNKLREQARPLLSLSQGVPSPTKQLRESGNDKPKESKAKKRLFRGRHEPPNGVIERRYGYIPNPRWPKQGSANYKSFEPSGIGSQDEEGVPGIVFREQQKLKQRNRKLSLNVDHSYQEEDFPQLSCSSPNTSLAQEKNDNLSKESVNILDCSSNEGKQTILTSVMETKSPSTSTPLRRSNVLNLPESPSPMQKSSNLPLIPTESCESSVNSVFKSEQSFNSSRGWESVTDKSSNSFIVQKKPERRRSKKLGPSPLAGTPSSNKSHVNSGDSSLNDSKKETSSLLEISQISTSWPVIGKSPGLVNSFEDSQMSNGKNKAQPYKELPNSDVNHNCNITVSPTLGSSWSGIVKAQSSLMTDERHRAAWNRVLISPQSGSLPSSGSKPVTSGTRQISPVPNNINRPERSLTPPLKNDQCQTQSISPSLSWSDIARGSPSAGDPLKLVSSLTSPQHPCLPSPVPVSSSESQIQSSKHSCPTPDEEQQGIQQKNSEGKSQKGKGTRSRNRKSKNGGNTENAAGQSSESKGKKQQSSGQRNSRKNVSNGPRALTLETFMTPIKSAGKKNGPANGKKDMSMLATRFVEHIEANPVSPPKKVRPSPIKRLSFSRGEEETTHHNHVMPGRGDATELNQLSDKQLNMRKITESRKSPEEENDKITTHCTSNGKENENTKRQNTKGRNSGKENTVVFSLENYFKKEKTKKDVFEDENEDEDEYPKVGVNTGSDKFWNEKLIEKIPSIPRNKVTTVPSLSTDEDEISDDDATFSPVPKRQSKDFSVTEDAVVIDGIEVADPSKVTFKSLLKKYARRYCQYVEEHEVPNIAVELYFITQLLTCTEVDKEMLCFIDKQTGGTMFRSVHNGVYFAVIVIKRLQRLFLTLNKTFLELLAASPRIEAFSPKLHRNFLRAIKSRPKDPVSAQIEHSTFVPQDDGAISFHDSNFAHVFKCQRDNFYAFYRHYHDTNSVYELKMENQILYVYDGSTPEQNSIVNLMHLAKLYLDHLILCCVHHSWNKVDIAKMIQSKGQDEELFTKLYEAFFETTNPSSGTACPAPGFSENQMFFKDFIDTLSCPAFNEHLRNLLVSRILELNSSSFDCERNLHSPVTVGADEMPLRTQKFTETVSTLCVMAKVLGYLTFAPYSNGAQTVPIEQHGILLNMREMSPIPLPFPLLLKQAFDIGSLSLTVPWIVEYLSMMDQMAPQLSMYSALLKKLHFIQRYAWDTLYLDGHRSAGLLIVSCISWLFEAPSIPEGFFFNCNAGREKIEESDGCTLDIDRQSLVSQKLLSSCCPYLDQGQVLLTLFALKKRPPVPERDVLPLTQVEETDDKCNVRSCEEIAAIEDWLGSSLNFADTKSKSKPNVIDDEVVPAYVLTRLFVNKDTDDLDDLELNLLLNTPYLKPSIDTAVDLLCAKVIDYTHRMILRVLIFDAKVEVRKKFHSVPQGKDADFVKDKISAEANLTAKFYSEKAQNSFDEIVERSCNKELPALIHFLTINTEKVVRENAVPVAKKMLTRRLQEWAKVQLGRGVYRRAIIREAEKCSRTNAKHLGLYPNDYSKKLDKYLSPELDAGFLELEQLSDLIDKALSYGVWYINALTPGPRPDDSHIIQLIEDFTDCIAKRMITMDFAFYVMSNFLMHLIIQYMVDAPHNWTDKASEVFIKLCHLCKDRKQENDKTSVKLQDFVKKKKRLKVKVLNLLSVYSVQWLTKSESLGDTLMSYCKLITSLVTEQLLHVETVFDKLILTRDNPNLDSTAKAMVNRVVVKILELLYKAHEEEERESCSTERVLKLVKKLASSLMDKEKTQWNGVMTELAERLKLNFGSVLSDII